MLYIAKHTDGSPIFICGKLGPHCSDCLAPAENLCDYPISKNKTCNRKVCHQHSHEIHTNHHYCSAHFQEYSMAATNKIFQAEFLGKNDDT